MRFRHRARRHSIRRRPGMKGDWVNLAKTECPFTGTNAQACDTAPASLIAAQLALIDSSDLHDKQDKLTIVRMVGAVNPVLIMEYNVSTPFSPPRKGIVQCVEGIYVTSADDNSAGGEQNPFIDTDFEMDTWLWLRSTSFGIVVGGAADGFDDFVLVGGSGTMTPPSAAQFDVRVKRKLEFGQNLLYACQWVAEDVLLTGLPTGTTLTQTSRIVAALRGYVKF